jgi:hypothetical protein
MERLSEERKKERKKKGYEIVFWLSPKIFSF